MSGSVLGTQKQQEDQLLAEHSMPYKGYAPWWQHITELNFMSIKRILLCFTLPIVI